MEAAYLANQVLLVVDGHLRLIANVVVAAESGHCKWVRIEFKTLTMVEWGMAQGWVGLP